jgi:transposase
VPGDESGRGWPSRNGESAAPTGSRLLRAVRPATLVAEQRKALARDLLADIRRLDHQLADIDRRLDTGLFEHSTTLTEIGGVGTVLTARIIAHSGAIDRFATDSHTTQAMPGSPPLKSQALNTAATGCPAKGTAN